MRGVLRFVFVLAMTMGAVARTEAAAPTFQWSDYTWKQGDPTLYLRYMQVDPHTGAPRTYNLTAANSVCFLTEIWGSFVGDRFVFLSTNPDTADIHDRTDDAWYLRGSFSGSDGGATARCVPLQRFSAYRSSGLMWDRFSVSSQNGSASAWMWWDDAIAALMGVRGDFDSTQDHVGVTPKTDNNPDNPTHVAFSIFSTSANYNSNIVWARSTYLGSRVSYVGRYTAQTSSSTSRTLGYTDEHFCYLTNMRGKFRGAGERVKIVSALESSTGRTRWSLRSQTSQGSSIGADAECIAY